MDGQNFETRLAAWDNERWNETCRHMQVALLAGSLRRAVRALDHFAGQQRLIQLSPDDATAELEFFGLDSVTLSLLNDHGYQTIRSVAQATDSALLQIPSMSLLRISQLRQAIELAGAVL